MTIFLPKPFLTIADMRHLIVGGHQAPKYDFLAIPRVQDGFICGASLVHADILITAAHCAVFFEEEETMFFIGASLLDGSDAIDEIRADEIRIHPDFDVDAFMDNVHGDEPVNPASVLHDIAIVKLQSASEATPVQWNRDPNAVRLGDSVVVLGFGADENGEFSDRLLETSIKVVDEAVCEVVWSPLGRIDSDSHICAGKPGAGACIGDSGGPLLHKGTLVGIISFGQVLENKSCDSGRLPNIFTRTSGYAGFTEQGICELSDFPPESCSDNVPTLSPSNNPTSEAIESWLTVRVHTRNGPLTLVENKYSFHFLFSSQSTPTWYPTQTFTSSPSDSLNSFEGLSVDTNPPAYWDSSFPTLIVTDTPKASPGGFPGTSYSKQTTERPSSMPSRYSSNKDPLTKIPSKEIHSTSSGSEIPAVCLFSLLCAAFMYNIH
jgi:hypothetical protein